MMYKVTVAFLAALAVATAVYVPNVHTVTVGNAVKDIALKQKVILQLLKNVNQKNLYPDLVALGRSWNPELLIDRYANQVIVKNFINMWNQGVLPRGEIFNVFNEIQLTEVIALFDLLYFAKDFDTFIKTAAWARDNINEGQFAYALSVAVIQREDFAGVVLPPLYEVVPQLYLHSGDIKDFVSAKMQGQISFAKIVNSTIGNAIVNPEQLLGYFTEDVGLNAYHAYTHLHMPFWLNCEKYGLKNCQLRGEAFIYYYQQIVAMYNLQRMANNLPELQDMSDVNEIIKTGYNPDLVYPNGVQFPTRPAVTELSSLKLYTIADIKAIELRIKDAIDSGFVLSKDGNKIPIIQYVKGINILGNLIEGNQNSVNPTYYGSLQTMMRNLLALVMDPESKQGVAPGVIGLYETALRDPAFYIIQKCILNIVKRYQDMLPVYKTDDLIFDGVVVQDVAVDKLVTYFDLFNIDVSNAVDLASLDEVSKIKYVAKTARLNHMPFTYKVKITSDKKVSAVVRVFLGPSTDLISSNFYGNQQANKGQGLGQNTADLERLRSYFVELDRFPVQLKNGDNLIERKSLDLTNVAGDIPSFNALLKDAESGHVIVNDQDRLCGIPDRLALPLGQKAGAPFTLFIIVSPLDQSELDEDISDMNGLNGLLSSNIIDNRPLGFPLDRQIDNFSRFQVPNMYFKDILIFHKDSSVNANVLINKNVNGFDNVAAAMPRKVVSSHRLMDEEIVRQDDDLRSYL